MTVYWNISNFATKTKQFVTIGVFDGVHLGHQHILQQLTNLAKFNHCQSTVLTFDKNPLEILNPEKAPQPITTLQNKIELLRFQKIDNLIIESFSKQFAEITAEDFITEILVKKINIKGILVSPNFRFGKNRLGDFNLLTKLATKYNFTVFQTNLLEIDGQIVSSTLVRQLIQNKEYKKASNFLGWDYETIFNN